jgi:hypothetical protein
VGSDTAADQGAPEAALPGGRSTQVNPAEGPARLREATPETSAPRVAFYISHEDEQKVMKEAGLIPAERP